MYQRLLLIPALVACFGFGMFVQAQGPDKKPADEIELLKAMYTKKRADALKPVASWYQAQLESMQKKYTQKGNLDGALGIQAEIKRFQEGSVDENDGLLKRALLRHTWSWSDSPTEKGIEMTFKDDPTVAHVGMHGNWKITGNREVTIIDSGNTKTVLRFDENVTEYRQVGGNLLGHRWK
jgi:hypothetical protein